MNIDQIHTLEKPVSAIPFFKGETGTATAIKLLKSEKLKEHTTKTPALLICINGQAVFENEKKEISTLIAGDFIHIEPNILHWITANETSNFILLK